MRGTNRPYGAIVHHNLKQRRLIRIRPKPAYGFINVVQPLRRACRNPISARNALEVRGATYANAYPKIAFGRPITEMEPFAKPIEMEST
jgi:hypothetical protein